MTLLSASTLQTRLQVGLKHGSSCSAVDKLLQL